MCCARKGLLTRPVGADLRCRSRRIQGGRMDLAGHVHSMGENFATV